MGIAMSFAFVILLIATGNIIMAIIAIVCVATIIMSIVAIMVFHDWALGISESLAIVIIVGLAVDYVVHLAADYMHSIKPSRGEKMQQSYAQMGVSILSGTVTTMACGIFLFGGQIILFNKFAVIITSTIGISFLTAMLLFGALCHVMGPQNGMGDICCCFKKKSDNQIAPDQKGQNGMMEGGSNSV